MNDWTIDAHYSWDFFGRNDAKAETPLLWPPHAKSWLTGKDSDAGRDWGQEEKGMTEDEMASWTRWTWVLVNSGSWWWTGRPGVLQFMGLQRVGHDWVTELNWPLFSASLVKEIVFSPLYILASFVEDKLAIGAWIYLWAFYFVPLIYIFVFVPVPYCLDDYSFVV